MEVEKDIGGGGGGGGGEKEGWSREGKREGGGSERKQGKRGKDGTIV